MNGIKAKIREKRYLRWLLVVSNWLFQGIIHADKTEKIYKIIFSLVFSLFSYFAVSNILNIHYVYKILLSFFIGHTINYLVNNNVITIIIHRLYIGSVTKEDLFNYIVDLSDRLKKESSIQCVSAFGSISRGELHDKSDLDISFVRRKGLRNALKSIWFLIKEKHITTIRKIPIEAFLVDDIQNMKNRYRKDETPVLIYDPDEKIIEYYSDIYSINDAAKVNNIS